MEEMLYSARIHPKALFKSLIVALCLAVATFFIVQIPSDTGWDLWNSWGRVCLVGLLGIMGLWYVVVPVLQWWNTKFTLTSERVKVDWGVLYKQSREIDLQRIASISEERGILDRIFGCGTLNFYDAAAGAQPHTGGAWNRGQSENGVKFHDVPEVKKVRSIVEKAKYNSRNSTDSRED